MTRSTATKLAFVLIVLAIVWEAYRYRIRIETWVWHARHGDSLTVGNYVFPVPANWHVEDLGNDSFILIRLDTDDHTSPRRYKQHAGIMLLHQRPMKDEALNRILTLESDQLKNRGVDPVPQHNFSLGDEMIDCIGGERMPGPANIPDVFDIQPVTWSCKSSGGLDLRIMGIEPDLNQVWEIVTHIRKRT